MIRRSIVLAGSGSLVAIAATMSDGAALSATVVTPSPAASTANAASVFNLTSSQVALIVLIVFACLTCLYLVFYFGRQVQTAAYIRDSLVSAVEQQEADNLRRALDSLAKYPLDPKSNPQPRSYPGFGKESGLKGSAKLEYIDPESRLEGLFQPPSSSPEEQKRLDEQRVKLKDEIEKNKQWEQKEQDLYDAKVRELEKAAKARAESLVPKSMDISLLGGGWAFLLEFSTVIVIIFTLLILGIAGVVTGRDITTILASVAGYVLGRATTGVSVGRPEAAPSTAKGSDEQRVESPEAA